MSTHLADERGYFGNFGGRWMPEALVAALDELTVAWRDAMADPEFTSAFQAILHDWRRFGENRTAAIDRADLDLTESGFGVQVQRATLQQVVAIGGGAGVAE